MVLESVLILFFLMCSCSGLQAPLLEKAVFSPLYILASFVKNNVPMGAWVYFWAVYLVPLVYISVFVPVPYCLDDYQFISVAQSCPTLCCPMNCSMPGLPVHHQLSEFTQTHVHWVGDAIQPSHPLSSPSPPAPNPSQHHSLFQWVNSSHEVAKVLEFQL